MAMRKFEDKLAAFPAFFKVEGEKVAIFGNGDEAFAKLRLLANTRADIVVYSDDPDGDLLDFANKNGATLINAKFSEDLLDHSVMVFAGTGIAELDRKIVAAARLKRIPANAVDQPDYCDFYTPALVNRAPLAIAIGTEGAGPVLGQIVRARIDQMLSPSLGPLARLAQQYRKAVDHMLPRGVTRRVFWRRFFTGDIADHVAMGNTSQARRIATRILREREEAQGHVWLVGAGPGAVDLLTLRAQRVMMEADVILYDALVPEDVVNMGRRDAECVSVGKRKGCHSKSQDEINTLLVELAGSGKRIVRLKSGDPLVYGRAGEEMAALREAGISYEIVPGITSAFAAAADFDLPLTLRGVSSSLVFTTGHDLTGAALPNWARLAIDGATIAVYMGRTVASTVATRLMQAGLDENTSVAVVENAGRSDKKMMHGTLQNLPALEARNDLKGPVMVIIGEAVAGARFDQSTPLIQAENITELNPQTTLIGSST
jgi:uroporphyrin-III C-methyltransferase/precorrin-2 dehydrogenase/sirohydrochlorin ferrochelatase